ncbi:exopolysaccharide biosynthesis protein [Rhodoferax aquaticus]|nr:exopolysaccharide biosynthesis protein [Rhodoferax aquaticus]
MSSTQSTLSVSFLRALARRRRARLQGYTPDPVTLQALLRLHGDASLVVVLLVLSVLTVVPVAGVGTILSFAIFAIAWRWAIGGLHRPGLPFEKSLNHIALSPQWSERVLRFMATLYTRADRWLHPRWPSVFHSRWAMGWAFWIAAMAAIIFLPLPLGNVLPSLSLVFLCLAWMFKDGLACLGSLIVGLAAIAYTAAFGQLVWAMGVQGFTLARSWLGL